MLTDKLTPYKDGSYPNIAGGEAKYITGELRRVSQAIASTQETMKTLATTGDVIEKAGTVLAADVAAGTWQVIHDSVHSTTRLYANIGGVLFAAPLV